VNRKADFFYKTNRFESIRTTNRIKSIRIVNWNALVSNCYIVLHCLFLLSTLHLTLGILRCPTRWQRSFCATATPSINISPSARFATVGASSSLPTSAYGAAFAFSCFLWHFCWTPEGFFFLWTMTGSPVSCKEPSSYGRVPTRGPSSECSLFLSSTSSVIRWGHGGWGVPGLVASYDIQPGDGVGLF